MDFVISIFPPAPRANFSYICYFSKSRTVYESINKKPKITVATVLKNDREGFEYVRRSVESQTYDLVEFSVIDGGSTDGTVDAIRQADSVDYFVSEPDEGIYDAMNKALDAASGDYIVFMNAGDRFYSPETIEKAARNFGEADLIYGGVMMSFGPERSDSLKKGKLAFALGAPDEIDEDGNYLYSWDDPQAELSDLNKKMVCSHQSLFMKTDLARRLRFDLEYPTSADFDMIFRAYKSGKKFKKLEFPVAVRAFWGYSETNEKSKIRERRRIVTKYDRSFKVRAYFAFEAILARLPRLLRLVIKTLLRRIFRIRL